MRIVLDIEALGLVPEEVSRLWCVVCQDLDTGEFHVFRNPTGDPECLSAPLGSFLSGVTEVVGQNILVYDWRVLGRFVKLPEATLKDTLVLSRLLKYDIEGGHSLEAWGQRLGEPKTDFHEFDRYSEQMVEYCMQDVRVTRKLYDFQLPYWQSDRWRAAIELEHQAAKLCIDIHQDGFGFDEQLAGGLLGKLKIIRDELDHEIFSDPAFGPGIVKVEEISPRETKSGTIHAVDFKKLVAAGYDPLEIALGRSYTITTSRPFNPGSPKQMVERLNSFGWRPTEKTKTHIEELRKRGSERNPEKLAHLKVYGWKVSEENLRTLPKDAPKAAHLLAQRLAVNARISDLEEWLALVQSDGRVHGTLLPIGSWTGRMAHRLPNTGNIASTFPDQKEYTPVEKFKHEYDHQLRACWRVADDHWQVGVDMESAHLRILAHLLNNPDYTESIVSGNKKLGTDIHSVNRRALGEDLCKSRDDSKTFIYAFINGAKSGKLATVLGCSVSEAKTALNQFIQKTPGLDRLLNEDVPRNAARGYFEGIDGRYIACDFEHGQLSGILQNAEAIVLKRSAYLGREKCLARGYPIKLLNLVHDEIQTELYDSSEELAHEVGRVFAEEYRLSAEHYGLRCPFAGGITIGKNWAGAH